MRHFVKQEKTAIYNVNSLMRVTFVPLMHRSPNHEPQSCCSATLSKSKGNNIFFDISRQKADWKIYSYCTDIIYIGQL